MLKVYTVAWKLALRITAVNKAHMMVALDLLLDIYFFVTTHKSPFLYVMALSDVTFLFFVSSLAVSLHHSPHKISIPRCLLAKLAYVLIYFYDQSLFFLCLARP